MCKMDGLTCSLTYENGRLIAAETRGNGLIGENILHNAKVISSIPKTIDYKNRLVVDGEIICKYDDFNQFSSEYKNPRNFAAGSIRLLDANECGLRKLTFIAWNVVEGFEECNSHFVKLNHLKKLNFLTVPFIVVLQSEEDYSFTDLDINHLKRTAMEMGYPIDGLVFKFDDIAYGNSLGQTSHHFKNAIAYKFYDKVYETKLLNIEWTMGRTGILTPIAIFEPIDMDGSIVERASLHNISVMQETLHGNGWKGQYIWVYKANMIIPQISKAQEDDEWTKEYFSIPHECPICGGPAKIKTENNSSVLFCDNTECEGQFINKLDHFCGKKGLDIKGLSKATLEKLVGWEWISTLSDIYNLEKYRNEWIKIPGFGEKLVNNILTAIENSKNTTLEAFISAIGIPLIGRSMSKELVKHIKTYDEFREKVNNNFNFSEYDGFAISKKEAILNFDYSEADKIYSYLNIQIPEEKKSDMSMAGLTFVITGRLQKFKNRSELEDVIRSHGGKISNSVSKNTSYFLKNVNHKNL